MFKGLSNIAGLMANPGKIQQQAEEMKEKLRAIRVEGSAGGGMVQVEMTGDQKVVAVNIEQSLLETGDKEMLEDLLVSATNQAIEQAAQANAAEAANMMSGLGIPGLGDALANLGGDAAGPTPPSA